MRNKTITFVFFFGAVVSSFAFNVEGVIDVCPAGFIADKTTPYAVHFSCWTTGFQGYSAVSAKLQIQSGIMSANNFTWSSTNNSWRDDAAGQATLNMIPVSMSTVSGWLFGISSSVTYFGQSTCKVRMYRPGSSFPYDIATAIPLVAWNTVADAGWIEGSYPSLGANIIVMAKDSSGKILGSYITEDNHIIEGYSNTTGYFKFGVPIGIVNHLEFRYLNNEIVGTFTGPWTISAGKITNIGHPTGVDSSDWNKY